MANDDKVQYITPVNNDGKTPKMFAIPIKSKTDRFFDSSTQAIIALNALGWIGWLLYPDKDFIVFWTVISLINIVAFARLITMMDTQEKLLKELIDSNQETVIDREKRLNDMMEKFGVAKR